MGVSWLMVEDFGKEKLMKMERLKVWIGLYIMIVEVDRACEHAWGEFGWLPSVILPWIGVVLTTVFFLFLWPNKRERDQQVFNCGSNCCQFLFNRLDFLLQIFNKRI